MGPAQPYPLERLEALPLNICPTGLRCRRCPPRQDTIDQLAAAYYAPPPTPAPFSVTFAYFGTPGSRRQTPIALSDSAFSAF
jgi:hypothetical protein